MTIYHTEDARGSCSDADRLPLLIDDVVPSMEMTGYRAQTFCVEQLVAECRALHDGRAERGSLLLER